MSALRLGGQAAPVKGIPIPKPRVAVILEDGSNPAHVNQFEAKTRVDEGRAHWDGIACGYPSQYDAIRMFPKQVSVRGYLDQWKVRESGNNLAGISVPRGCKGMRGELVLQLV